MKIQVKRGVVRWYYVIRSRNGKITETGQKYFSKSNAIRAARRKAASYKTAPKVEIQA